MARGLVIKSTGSWYIIESNDGDIVTCRIKGNLRLKGLKTTNPVSVGDYVEYELEKDKDTGVISDIEERRNYVIRQSTNLSKRWHIIGANIDQSILVVSLKQPRTRTGFIDRFLVSSEAYGVPATIVFNKIDIYGEEENNELEFLMNTYTSIGYSCIAISVDADININLIQDTLRGKTSLFSGHSGVGKSSLLNKLNNQLAIKTGVISDAHEKGKHTTTFAELHYIDKNTRVIDTPGVRSFGIVDFKREEVATYFPEFFRLSVKCKYHNCIHINEPGCAVKSALETGEVAAFRYNNYINIYDSDNYREEWE